MTDSLTLYSYWRSSAAYRVRIALNLKGMDYVIAPVQLVPTLVDGGRVLRQSLAIIEYLDDAYPDTPRLLPGTTRRCARVRAIAQMIACDIHPLGNLRVLQYLERELHADETQR